MLNIIFIIHCFLTSNVYENQPLKNQINSVQENMDKIFSEIKTIDENISTKKSVIEGLTSEYNRLNLKIKEYGFEQVDFEYKDLLVVQKALENRIKELKRNITELHLQKTRLMNKYADLEKSKK